MNNGIADLAPIVDEDSGDDEMDLDEIENARLAIDVGGVALRLEYRGSADTTAVVKHCEAENEKIREIRQLIYDRLEELKHDVVTPNILIDQATDAWIHIIETLSDHVEDAEKKAKHC